MLQGMVWCGVGEVAVLLYTSYRALCTFRTGGECKSDVEVVRLRANAETPLVIYFKSIQLFTVYIYTSYIYIYFLIDMVDDGVARDPMTW